MHIFGEVLFLRYVQKNNQKNQQQLKNEQLIQLILCQFDVGGWQKEEGLVLVHDCWNRILLWESQCR